VLSLFLRRRRAERVPPDTRIYAIGDVHGRKDLLDRLLQALEQDNVARGNQASTILIYLGDLIDRGPESRGVVHRAMASLDWARTIALMGNHEAAMLAALDGDQAVLADWLDYGGDATLTSWGVARSLINGGASAALHAALLRAVTRDEYSWMARMRNHFRCGDYFFVHAGVRPGVALDAQSDDDCFWIRDDFLKSRRHHGAMIVHGHTPARAIAQRPNRIGIDTGAYATGKLTALCLEGTDRWFIQT
jgi:serine/threonine protein phosphatase 1